MTKILVISSRDLEKGSTKYRVAQYHALLAQRGLHIQYVKRGDPASELVRMAREVDVVLNQKCLIRTPVARKIMQAAKLTIFDFDDAIYTRSGKPYSFFTGARVRRRLSLWLERADVVTTANQVLASYARQYSERVEIIPMALDTEVWKPVRAPGAAEVVIGWAGSPVNLKLLERLEPVLGHVASTYPKVRISVFSGKRPALNIPFDFVCFEPGKEASFVQGLDIGLLPLTTDEYSTGKSPIKAIQYLACGVPVVGDIFGATSEILDASNSVSVTKPEEWYTALGSLIDRPDLRRTMGDAGREFAVRAHDATVAVDKLVNLIGQLGSASMLGEIPNR